MADTAHKTAFELAEHFDDPAELNRKLDLLAKWVRKSKSFAAFSGAGLSTSAGISDFRGPDGMWTKKAQGRKVGTRAPDRPQPTIGHMALVELQKNGILHKLISTNTDGLHLRSGFPREALIEIHGNTNLEECVTEPIGACDAPYGGDGCGSEFFRDERCRMQGIRAHEHATGRWCPCGRPLQDTIINFNENLRARNVAAARAVAAEADCMLSLGSSLRVSSWAPAEVADRRGARLIVCNLQWTPLDEHADLVIHARTDTVLAGLCRRLRLTVPPVELRRCVTVSMQPAESEAIFATEPAVTAASNQGANAAHDANGTPRKLVIHATDAHGKVPYAFLTAVEAHLDGQALPTLPASGNADPVSTAAMSATAMRQVAREKKAAGDGNGALAALRESKRLEAVALCHTVAFALPRTACAGDPVRLTLRTKDQLGEAPFEVTHALRSDSLGQSYSLSRAVPTPTLTELAVVLQQRREEAHAAEQAGDDVTAAELDRSMRKLEALYALRREMEEPAN